jgi:hypothetical protein
MKTFYKAFLAAILLPALSYAQSNYKLGYVVNLKGDTLHGYINYKEWDNNPKFIAFKRNPGQANAETFTTKTAMAFAITGQLYYQRFSASVSEDPVDITNMNSRLDTSYRVDTIFMRLLNKGRYISLYSYRDNIKSRFYLLEANESQPNELIYHAYSSFNLDESTAIQHIRRYRTQLQNIIQKNNINNDRLVREISESNYSESDLTDIVHNINGNTSIQFTTPNLFGIRFFAGPGINCSSLKFTGEIELAGLPASNSIAPKINTGIDFFTNKNIRKFYLRAEFSFTYGQYKFSYSNPVSSPSGTSSLNVKLYNMAFTPQFIFNFYNSEQFKAFVDAGIGINFAHYNNYQFITKYDSFPTSVTNDYPDLEKYFMNVPVKTGIEIDKQLEIYVCYVPSVSITGVSATAFKSNITSYQAGLNYLFK